ncbi:hypothetical protein KQY27_06165 [Methanobrevibacter sp. TMH8]|uniref:hypothetical protein n=1 Tax=Methanobrevibacter sp. TMH8 TaxID=2848611 RepID=UPI001CCF39C7|nr:hypothetical protein [Methanobrevibacter sp. TMH8]MBZ9571122.1 hypothetical protein [Methanobrevibacter sp. TMH8]
MSFDEWSNGKKVAIILIIIVAVVCVVGAVSIMFISSEVQKTTDAVYKNINDSTVANRMQGDANVLNVTEGQYKVKIETENPWSSYITTDSKYLQDSGSGSKIIDLGTVNTLSSITIDQNGSGTTKVSILDSNNKTIIEKTNSIDYGSIYILLRVR